MIEQVSLSAPVDQSATVQKDLSQQVQTCSDLSPVQQQQTSGQETFSSPTHQPINNQTSPNSAAQPSCPNLLPSQQQSCPSQGFVNPDPVMPRQHSGPLQNSPAMQQKPSPPVQSPVALPVQHR